MALSTAMAKKCNKKLCKLLQLASASNCGLARSWPMLERPVCLGRTGGCPLASSVSFEKVVRNLRLNGMCVVVHCEMLAATDAAATTWHLYVSWELVGPIIRRS